MQKNNNIGVWIFLTVIAMAIILALLFSKSEVNWNSRYELDDKHPYGLSFIHELLRQQAGNDRFSVITDPFHEVYESLDTNQTYLYTFIGYDRNYDSIEMMALLDFVAAGNTVFTAAEYLNSNLVDTLLDGNCMEWHMTYSYHNENDSVSASFSDSLEELLVEILEEDTEEEESDAANDTVEYDIGLGMDDLDEMDNWMDEDLAAPEAMQYDSSGYWESNYTDHYLSSRIEANFEDVELCVDTGYVFYYYFLSDTQSVYWTYFSKECLTDNEGRAEVLGYTAPSLVNYIRIPHGKGYFYMHTNPELFTNIELLEHSGLRYSEGVFAYLPDENILWDEYVTPLDMSWDLNELDAGNPLSYILSEPPLRWAIYLILAGTMLFILFRAKRRQQYIPVVEPNVNTSLEYVEMLGQLYYEQKDHRYMAGQLWRQFIDFVRSYYYFSPAELKGDWTAKLAAKSRVGENRIKGIERAYIHSDRPACEEADLINLYNKLKYFYSNCK